MPSSQQTTPGAFEGSGGKSAAGAPSQPVAPPTTHRVPPTRNFAEPPRPKYETDPADLEELPGHEVTSAPEAVLPTRRYVPGSAAGSAAPTVPLRFTGGGR